MPVAFPNLGIELQVDRIAISVGGFSIYWYAICIAVGATIGICYLLYRMKQMRVDTNAITDIVLSTLVVGILGARLYYVLFQWDYFSNHITEIFNIRDGGIAIYGGIIAGAFAVIIGCKYKKIALLPTLDVAVISLLIAQGIGRWGNFFNQEAFGNNTNSLFGMYSASTQAYLSRAQSELLAQGILVDPTQPVHPCFLYESIWCLLGAAIFIWYAKHSRLQGEMTCFYAVWYGAGRIWIEGLRTDSLMLGPVRVSQIVAGLCIVIGTLYYCYLRRNQASKRPV